MADDDPDIPTLIPTATGDVDFYGDLIEPAASRRALAHAVRRVSGCGLSQGEEPIEVIEQMCYNQANVGFGCTVAPSGAAPE